MDYVRLRGEEHQFPMPVKMILYSLEAAQDLMVAVRDLRRTVRLVQSGCVTFFPEEAHGLQLIYNTLEADLQQVEVDGQRITQHLLTALAASYEDIVRVAGFSRPSTRGVWVNHLYLVPAADGGMTDQAGLSPVPIDARPFRLIIQTIHITATLGGFLDRRTMRQAVDTVVEVAFMLLRSGVPPNLRIWTTTAVGTNSTMQRLQPNTLLAEVARMMAPAIRFSLLVQDPPTAAIRSPDRELSAPELVLL